eukprot:scaffold42976_cov199-Amphora_coffeaeformis.AAC.3
MASRIFTASIIGKEASGPVEYLQTKAPRRKSPIVSPGAMSTPRGAHDSRQSSQYQHYGRSNLPAAGRINAMAKAMLQPQRLHTTATPGAATAAM